MKSTTHPTHLIVFGRYPRPGGTKTRLIPALGPVGAAALQKCLTEQIVTETKKWARRRGVTIVFCHHGATSNQMIRWLGQEEMTYQTQSAGDLGRRMLFAIQTSFAKGARRVLLMGTDVLRVTSATLDEALNALNRRDIVLGPSTDGGYWLVGMSRPVDLFAGIAWSRPDVLEKTIKLADIKGSKPFLLTTLTDLDTPADLGREGVTSKITAPYVSVIIPTLNEERHLAPTLAAARSVDAEIIVSDGGSTDRSVELARSMGARVVFGKPGRAVQQNRGAWAARGRVLLFLHADTRLPPDYGTHIFHTLMDREIILGAFGFGTDLQTPAMEKIALLANLRAKWLHMPYGDQGLFLRRTDFLKVGGFPDQPIAEDLFLVRRLRRRGRIAIAPAVVTTSARRWRRLGILRTTLINTIIAIGCIAGVAPERLATLYRLPKRPKHEQTETSA